MSQASANAFVDRMKNDCDFATQVGKAKTKRERWAILKANGFEFTEDEFRETFGALMGGSPKVAGKSAFPASVEGEARKTFVLPEVQKHKAIAAIAGSGGDHSCIYASRDSMYYCDYYF